MALARPCAMPNRAPTACASAWLTPTNALENASPAIVAAFDIAVRASRSLPSAYARGSASKIRFIACMQNASVNGEAKIDTAASSACVSASIPVSAVSVGGIVERQPRVDDRHVRHERVVDERDLAPVDRDDRGRGDLRPRAGGRRNGDEPCLMLDLRVLGDALARVEERQRQLAQVQLRALVEEAHGLRRVEHRAAADRDDQVRPELVHRADARADLGLGRLRRDRGEDVDGGALGKVRAHLVGDAALLGVRVGDEEHLLDLQLTQAVERAGVEVRVRRHAEPLRRAPAGARPS